MTGSALSDELLARLGVTRELADEIGRLTDQCGPFTPEQRDQLAVLLRPDPPLPLAGGRKEAS